MSDIILVLFFAFAKTIGIETPLVSPLKKPIKASDCFLYMLCRYRKSAELPFLKLVVQNYDNQH